MKADDINANRFVLDPKSTAEIQAKFKSDPQTGLKAAAQQFEGMLLQMVLKSMRDTVPQDGLMESDQTRFYTSIMDQQLAQNLAARGTLGFAQLIEQQLGRNTPAGSSDQSASSLEALQQSLLRQQLLDLQQAPQASSLTPGGRASGAASVQEGGASSGATSSTREFVNRVWPYAQEAASRLGVPTRFLVAHSALESGWGRSEIRLPDGSPSYNLFGVKAGRGWSGSAVEVQTTEYVNGEAQSAREKFRVYSSYAEAFQDYANLLKNSPRFSQVVGQQDGTQFARALQQAGYATDPAYAEKLGRIINSSSLQQAVVG